MKIAKIEIKNLHHRFDITLGDLDTGLNVVHAENGAGKTTALHVLANLLNGDLERFLYIDFDSIDVEFSHGARPITIRSEPTRDQVRIKFNLPAGDFVLTRTYGELSDQAIKAAKKQRASMNWDAQQLPSCSYFPAFRNIVEAWDSRQEELEPYARYIYEMKFRQTDPTARGDVTKFARQLFGDFVPRISYPTPHAIEATIGDEIRTAQMRALQYERRLTSKMFLEILETVLGNSETPLDTDPDELFREISKLDTGTEVERRYQLDRRRDESLATVKRMLRDTPQRKHAIPALEKYKNALDERQRFTEEEFRGVESYLSAINEFYSNKKIDVDIQEKRPPKLVVRYADGTSSPLSVLSSGERQILTLLFAASRISKQEIVLLDEPEISLHVDWQSPLLQRMADLLEGKQIIACTHSPTLASNHLNSMVELKSHFSRKQ